MKCIVIPILRLYKLCISPLLPVSCRFTPTCSEYAMQAFETHPFFSALKLTMKRLGRCNPWFEGGYDPVPNYQNRDKHAN